MGIGGRIRALREQKHLSQGDIEEKTGLLRCYISRVENGHTVPSLETLERFAGALDVPLYKLFYNGEDPTQVHPQAALGQSAEEAAKPNEESRFVLRLKNLQSYLSATDREMLLTLAKKLAGRAALAEG